MTADFSLYHLRSALPPILLYGSYSVNFKTVKNKTKTHVYWFISSAEAVQKKKKKSLEIRKIVWSSNAKFLFQIYFLLIFI